MVESERKQCQRYEIEWLEIWGKGPGWRVEGILVRKFQHVENVPELQMSLSQSQRYTDTVSKLPHLKST